MPKVSQIQAVGSPSYWLFRPFDMSLLFFENIGIRYSALSYTLPAAQSRPFLQGTWFFLSENGIQKLRFFSLLTKVSLFLQILLQVLSNITWFMLVIPFSVLISTFSNSQKTLLPLLSICLQVDQSPVCNQYPDTWAVTSASTSCPRISGYRFLMYVHVLRN